jgi:anaerobic ribonucleoside-triphosphate reductase activating protein
LKLALNKAHYPVSALGPGIRVGLWTQGCSIHCADCLSVDTWEQDPGRAIEVTVLLGWIRSLDRGPLDGITISGGEPFDQPEAILELVLGLRAWDLRRTGEVDVLCYSGYPLARLRREHAELLEVLDAVIAEPFNRRLPTDLIWRGSANQRLQPLSVLGRSRYESYLDARPERPPMQVEVGRGISYIGVPRIGDMERLERRARGAGLDQRGVSWRA